MGLQERVTPGGDANPDDCVGRMPHDPEIYGRPLPVALSALQG